MNDIIHCPLHDKTQLEEKPLIRGSSFQKYFCKICNEDFQIVASSWIKDVDDEIKQLKKQIHDIKAENKKTV